MKLHLCQNDRIEKNTQYEFNFGVLRVNTPIENIHCDWNKISHKHLLRGCLHEISFLAKWNTFNSVSSQSLVIVYMKYLETKLTARVISLRSFWQKLNFILGDKCHQNTILKLSHLEGNICAYEFFIKIKIVDQQIKIKSKSILFCPQWKLM